MQDDLAKPIEGLLELMQLMQHEAACYLAKELDKDTFIERILAILDGPLQRQRTAQALAAVELINLERGEPD